MAKVKSSGCVSVPALCLVFITLVGAMMMMAPQMVDAKTDPGDIQALMAVSLFINHRSMIYQCLILFRRRFLLFFKVNHINVRLLSIGGKDRMAA